MQSTNWAGAHSGALREYLAKGMSFSEIAEAINAKFKTAYSRSAAIGRARRMGLAGPDGAKDPPRHWPAAPKAPQPQPPKSRERHVPEFIRPVPMLKRTGTAKLRCVGIDPRHLSLTDLEPDDCRYPYGGEEEGEAITFCGHPRRHGSSYCASHFHLTRGPVRHRNGPLAPSHSARGGGMKRRAAHERGGHHEAVPASPPRRAFA